MIPLPLPPKVIEKKDKTARFEIAALYPGYGVTIGICLRRILLSSLSGAAITSVRIKNVQHEFSTLPGVLEDVITIMLNLKQLRFKVFSEESQRISLKVKGEKEVRGSDFKLSGQIELVNKDALIATLTDKKAELEIEALIEKGLGYEPVEKRKKDTSLKLEIGEIPLDAIFTPVLRVSFRVENMRVGERTDFDKLILDINTDGTIEPEDALSRASEILAKHFSFLKEAFEKKEKTVSSSKPATKKEETAKKIKVEDLKLSGRVINALLSTNIKTVGGILKKKEEELLGAKGLGKKAVKEIKSVLKKLGLELN